MLRFEHMNVGGWDVVQTITVSISACAPSTGYGHSSRQGQGWREYL